MTTATNTPAKVQARSEARASRLPVRARRARAVHGCEASGGGRHDTQRAGIAAGDHVRIELDLSSRLRSEPECERKGCPIRIRTRVRARIAWFYPRFYSLYVLSLGSDSSPPPLVFLECPLSFAYYDQKKLDMLVFCPEKTGIKL